MPQAVGLREGEPTAPTPKNAKVKPSEHHSTVANSPTPASFGASVPGFFFAKDTNRTKIEGREARRGDERWAEEAGRGGQKRACLGVVMCGYGKVMDLT